MKSEFTHNLKTLFFLMKVNLDKNLLKYDLTASQLEVLHFIMRQPNNVNQREIERGLNLSNPTINGLLSRLEEKKFICRVRDKEDMRNKKIVICPKCREILEEVEVDRCRFEEKIYNDISMQELEVVNNFIIKIINNLEGE